MPCAMLRAQIKNKKIHKKISDISRNVLYLTTFRNHWKSTTTTVQYDTTTVQYDTKTIHHDTTTVHHDTTTVQHDTTLKIVIIRNKSKNKFLELQQFLVIKFHTAICINRKISISHPSHYSFANTIFQE